MDNSTPDILVQYLDGELSGPEKQRLEQQLSQDAGLQEQMNSLRSAKEAIRLYGLKQKVSGIHAAMMEELQPGVVKMQTARPGKKFIRYSIAVAASIVLLIAGYMILNQGKPSSEKIFASNYSRYELVTMRDGGGEQTKVEKAYRAGNYEEVLRI